MAYIDPHDVVSPQGSVSNLMPVFDDGEWEFSVALLHWDRKPRVALRWNGGTEEEGNPKPTPGNPQSRGLPTWFVLPPIFDVPILQALLDGGKVGGRRINAEDAEQTIRQAIESRRGGQEPPRQAVIRQEDAEFEERIIKIILRMRDEGRLSEKGPA